MLLLLLLEVVSLHLNLWELLSRSHRWSSACSQLHSQLLLMLLHQLKLVGQLLKNILLLRREILCLLKTVEHLKLLLRKIEGRSLLLRLLLLDRLLSRLKSFRWYCIIVALDGIGWRSSWISLLKGEEMKI